MHFSCQAIIYLDYIVYSFNSDTRMPSTSSWRRSKHPHATYWSKNKLRKKRKSTGLATPYLLPSVVYTLACFSGWSMLLFSGWVLQFAWPCIFLLYVCIFCYHFVLDCWLVSAELDKNNIVNSHALSSWLLQRLFPGMAKFANAPFREKIKDRQGLINLSKQVALDNFAHYTFIYFPVFYVFKEAIQVGASFTRPHKTCWPTRMPLFRARTTTAHHGESCRAAWIKWVRASDCFWQ